MATDRLNLSGPYVHGGSRRIPRGGLRAAVLDEVAQVSVALADGLAPDAARRLVSPAAAGDAGA